MNTTPAAVQVNPAYSHYEKVIRSHGVLDSISRYLKWYDISHRDQPIKQTIRELAQRFVSRRLTSDSNPSSQELGFVLLHRCGEDFYFLGICTWRGNNELWKTMYYLEANTMDDFAVFQQQERHKDTFCVWELAVVSHETEAWTTYLKSNRTDQDSDRYVTTLI